MEELPRSLEIAACTPDALCDGRLGAAYRAYVSGRVRFLLARLERYAGFPGIHMGYNAITGEEFAGGDLVAYGWINGRAACTLSRFARCFAEQRSALQPHALRAVRWIERYADGGRGRVPFTASLDGRTVVMPCPERTDGRTYSDLYCSLGLLEYGVTFDEASCVDTARRMLEQTLVALAGDAFLMEPDPAPAGGQCENPWSVALDVANEMAKQLQEPACLDVAAGLVRHVLDRYYLPDAAALAEYVGPDGRPVEDPQGRRVVDPGHSIEWASFALEFSRLAERAERHEALRTDVNRVGPELIACSLARGRNPKHPGIVKSLDLHSGAPVDGRMPWWSLPETMLALLMAFERTADSMFLERFRDVNNAYVSHYLNPRTGYGPYQTLDGATGRPIDAAPACKFQDPEFHSGKNLLSCVEVLQRIRDARHGHDR